jgi:hypothetical protein
MEAADSLEQANPFLPPGYGAEEPEPAAPPPQTNGPLSRELEFRGIVTLNGETQFSIFDRRASRSYWLRTNQVEDGLTVRGYDSGSQTITVSKGGRSERLSLKSATDAPLPVVASTTSPQTNNANARPLPPGLQNPNVNRGDNNDNNRRRVIPRRRVVLPNQQ